MKSYFELKYIFNINKVNANLKSLNFKDNVCLNEHSKIVRLVYTLFSIAKIFLGKFVWYALFIPLFLYMLKDHIDDINTNFSVYYYYAIFFFQLASKISKSKVLSAEETEYHYIKTFRYPPQRFVRLKKQIAILDMLMETMVIAFLFIYGGIDYHTTIGAVFIIQIINFSSAIVFFKMIDIVGEKYLKLKYPLTIIANLVFPFLGIFIVRKFGLHTYKPSLFFCIISFLCVLVEIILFYNIKNENQICRLILKEYYYDNSLLESLEQDELSSDKPDRETSKKGFEYFNYIFFLSHRGLIIRNCIGKCILLLGLSIFCFFSKLQLSMQYWNWIISLFPLFLYQLSMSSKICTMFWKNCDINMYGHAFYKNKKSQLALKKYRLKWLLSINGMLSFVFLVIILICIKIVQVNFDTKCVMFWGIAVILIMLLHSLFDFYIYYYFKPHAHKRLGMLINYLLKIAYLSILGGIMIFFNNVFLIE